MTMPKHYRPYTVVALGWEPPEAVRELWEEGPEGYGRPIGETWEVDAKAAVRRLLSYGEGMARAYAVYEGLLSDCLARDARDYGLCGDPNPFLYRQLPQAGTYRPEELMRGSGDGWGLCE